VVIEGGWVCRACWRPNGANEKRCYRCHTPRDQQLSVEPGSLKAQTEPGYELKGRLDADLSILAYLTVWPLRVLGGLGITIGISIALASLTNAVEGEPDVLGLPFNTYLTLFGIFVILFGVLQIFLARSVRRHAQWAYAVVLVISVFWFIASLVGLYLPASTEGVAASSATFSAWIYFLMALGSAALLLTSFIRREVA
jgi:hypothetical protein